MAGMNDTSANVKAEVAGTTPRLEMLGGLIPLIRNRRKVQDNDWLLYHSAWMAKKTQFYYLGGVADHYVPVMRRLIERAVVRGRQQLLPTQDFFEVYPWNEQAPGGDGAEFAKSYMLFLLTQRMKIRSYVDQCLRSFYLYGRTVVKNVITVVDEPQLIGRTLVPIRRVWPISRNVDPFSFFYWPETATSVDEMQIMFEDVMVPIQQYQSWVDQKIVTGISFKDLSRPDWPLYHTVRLQSAGLVTPENTGGTDTEQFVAMSEVWVRNRDHFQQSWIVWNAKGGPKEVRFKERSIYIQTPYRIAFARPLPGESYTNGMGSDLHGLQVWFNDTLNITQDGMFMQMSPPIQIDPATTFRPDSIVIAPRQKWLISPESVKIPEMPDVSSVGLQNLQMIMGFMDNFSGSNPLADGTPQRGMPRAGFAVSTLVNLALSDIKGVAEIQEDEILTPSLNDLYRLGIVLTPPDQRFILPRAFGLNAGPFAMKQLRSDYTYRWVGSIQSQDLQVKAQRMLTFGAQLAKMDPAIRMQGKKINWGLWAKRVWREGIGERGGESIISDMTAQELQQMQQMQAAMQPNPVKINASLKGDLSPAMAADLADGKLDGKIVGGGNQPVASGQGQSQAPGPVNPATAEAAQRADARNMTESAIGSQGTGS